MTHSFPTPRSSDLNPLLTVLALGGLPFVNVLGKRFSDALHPEVMAIQEESAQLAGVVEESVAGVRVVKGFGAEQIQYDRLSRSEEHTSELQSLMRISYAVFCLKTQKQQNRN